MKNFRLQLITDGYFAEDYISGAAAALDGGCRWIQLRMKNAESYAIVAVGRKLAELCRKHDATFIIDDHVELVDSIGADGVHLGKNDMAVDEARQILGNEKIIGATANTIDDLRRASRLGADYAGLGPFRFTTTKKNLSPVLGTDGYRNILNLCRRGGLSLPIVAIGGITASDIPDIMAAGVDGIAISGAILKNADPAAETKTIMQTIQNSIIQ